MAARLWQPENYLTRVTIHSHEMRELHILKYNLITMQILRTAYYVPDQHKLDS